MCYTFLCRRMYTLYFEIGSSKQSFSSRSKIRISHFSFLPLSPVLYFSLFFLLSVQFVHSRFLWSILLSALLWVLTPKSCRLPNSYIQQYRIRQSHMKIRRCINCIFGLVEFTFRILHPTEWVTHVCDCQTWQFAYAFDVSSIGCWVELEFSSLC